MANQCQGPVDQPLTYSSVRTLTEANIGKLINRGVSGGSSTTAAAVPGGVAGVRCPDVGAGAASASRPRHVGLRRRGVPCRPVGGQQRAGARHLRRLALGRRHHGAAECTEQHRAALGGRPRLAASRHRGRLRSRDRRGPAGRTGRFGDRPAGGTGVRIVGGDDGARHPRHHSPADASSCPEADAPGRPRPGPGRAGTSPAGTSVLVIPGDTLWSIAREHSPGATDAQLDRTWREIWRHNRDVIGDDPDVIRPGQRLELGEEEG
uniref:LysM peptidoglycan-binding domain-containing protein n=1 Tax=Nocardioides alcanivorans TaxID=2897352 RepID=UPI0035D79A0A